MRISQRLLECDEVSPVLKFEGPAAPAGDDPRVGGIEAGGLGSWYPTLAPEKRRKDGARRLVVGRGKQIPFGNDNKKSKDKKKGKSNKKGKDKRKARATKKSMNNKKSKNNKKVKNNKRRKSNGGCFGLA